MCLLTIFTWGLAVCLGGLAAWLDSTCFGWLLFFLDGDGFFLAGVFLGGGGSDFTDCVESVWLDVEVLVSLDDLDDLEVLDVFVCVLVDWSEVTVEGTLLAAVAVLLDFSVLEMVTDSWELCSETLSVL